MSEIHDLPVVELAAEIRAGRLSPVELTEHYLARIAALDRRVGAFISVDPELAREQAGKAEQLVRDEPDPTRLPRLLGVPVPVKDLTAVSGLPTRYGSALYASAAPATEDAGPVLRLRESGAVLIGKTNTPEFGLPCHTENAIAPPTRTPWDPTRSAGGSSGGAAAAVAAGLAPLAHGSDGGGSIRIPAAACGVVGLKPSRGRVSVGPHGTELLGLVAHGPLARRVADAAALLDVLAHTRPGDAAPLAAPRSGFLAHTRRVPGRLRIAVHRTPAAWDAPVHPDCHAAVDDAAALLSALGHDVEPVPGPVDGTFMEHFAVLWAAGAAATQIAPTDVPRLDPLTRWLRARGAGLDARELLVAHGELQRLARRVAALHEAYDAVLTPTLAQPPVPLGYFRDQEPEENFRRQCAFSPFCSVSNVTGQPAISLPTYRTDAGLPIGVLLVGRHGAEGTLLSLAAQMEDARPWAGRTPPGW